MTVASNTFGNQHYGRLPSGKEPFEALLDLYQHPLLYQMAEKLRRIQVNLDRVRMGAVQDPDKEMGKIEEDLAKIRTYTELFEHWMENTA